MAESPSKPQHGSVRWLTIIRMSVAVCGEPLVSIVTPTLNQGRFIEATIRSIKGQRYRHFEHIVVDGGSTDETLEILRRHEGTYPMRWISEPDHGMYDAVNKGIRLAKGEILAYLNSDDLYFPWTLEAAVDVLRADPTPDLVFGDAVTVLDGTCAQRIALLPPFDRRTLLITGSLMQPAVFWRRRLVERIGLLDVSFRYVGDLDYWLRATEQGIARHIDEVLALELIHGSNLSLTAREVMAAEDVRMRTSHGGGNVASPASRRRATLHTKAWRRGVLLRFMAAFLPFGSGWPHFRHEGELRVSWLRLLGAFAPGRGDLMLANAITSEAASRLLRDG